MNTIKQNVSNADVLTIALSLTERLKKNSTIPSLNNELSLFFSNFEHCIADQLSSFSSEPFLHSLIHPSDESDIRFIERFLKASYCSIFFEEQILKHPQLLNTLFGINSDFELDESYFNNLLILLSDQQSLNMLNEADFNKLLRLLRNQVMVLVIWLDLNRIYSQEKTTRALSILAEFCIQKALTFHNHALSEKLGRACANNIVQPFFVIGMGKLGAWELNLSSDIDLIFAYPESGHTQHIENEDTQKNNKKTVNNQAFFNRLGQKLIQTLDNVTGDGFVFRVDMRLRPFGQSGALTYNFAALEDYYQTQGREWERYAMVKSRVVAFTGKHDQKNASITAQYKEQLENLLTQFTYRKFIDYSVIDALRSLKKMIVQDIARRKLGDNIKLGQGGIREIEFIAQSFQLLRGGRDITLQDNRVSIILPLLEHNKYLPEGVAKQLLAAYQFLRNTEHALQAYKDEQTQTLPCDNCDQSRLAFAMGFDSWDAFYNELQTHRRHVSDEFKCVIAPTEPPADACSIDGVWEHIWQSTLSQQEAIDTLSKNGHEDPEKTLRLLNDLYQSNTVQSLQAQARSRLDIFIPRLLAHITVSARPTQTLTRILKLVKSIIRRSAYILLLIENPNALVQLVKLSEASPQIADNLAAHPALLDELLDSRSLYYAPPKAELASELHASMLRIEQTDLEAQMEALRYFKAAHSLRVAACEITGAMPLMKVSDYLSNLADVILEYTQRLCWQDLIAKHGYPDSNKTESPDFIIVGYGKLGGLEMSHGSDLDLVFIHNAQPHGYTDGDKPIDNQRFYMRLGQKIIHILDTRTAGGQLYEVDMRLRPSGNSGPLVPTIAAFEKYQLEKAWTWEHQALVRARFIAGDNRLKTEFERIRRHVLGLPRDQKTLKHDVLEMREKMRAHLGTKPNSNTEENFHIKHDAGGIVDIEFMVQYAVLAWAHAHPALMQFTDNIRILESLQAASLFTAQQATELIDAYKALRATGHRLALQQDASVINDASLKTEQEKVMKHWQNLFAHG